MANTVVSGKRRGWSAAYYCTPDGSFLKCQVLSGAPAGPFTIYVPSLKPAGIAVARKTGVPLATSRNQVNAVHAAVR